MNEGAEFTVHVDLLTDTKVALSLSDVIIIIGF